MPFFLSLFSIVAYVYFFWTLPLQATGFMINFGYIFPCMHPYFLYSVDLNDEFFVEGFWKRLIVNVGLLGAFAIPHSVLARPATKAKLAMGKWERPFFVFQAALLLHILIKYWQPLDETIVWSFLDPWTQLLALVMYFGGWLWLVSATFAIDHFELFGLKQGLGIDVYSKIGISAGDGVVQRFHYRFVRHPLMLGFLVMFFCVPTMTVTHFFFSVACTTYILLAVTFLEEVDLTTELGDGYKAYQNSVPMLCPFKCGKTALAKEAPPPSHYMWLK